MEPMAKQLTDRPTLPCAAASFGRDRRPASVSRANIVGKRRHGLSSADVVVDDEPNVVVVERRPVNIRSSSGGGSDEATTKQQRSRRRRPVLGGRRRAGDYWELEPLARARGHSTTAR